MASRRIEDLDPRLQPIARAFMERIKEANVSCIITCTTRSAEEQMELYARGRTKPGKKVTWTLLSKHIKGFAFDIAIMRGKQVEWDIKADVDVDGIPDYLEAGRIGESLGLVWGGRWSKPDYPHFELREEEA